MCPCGSITSMGPLGSVTSTVPAGAIYAQALRELYKHVFLWERYKHRETTLKECYKHIAIDIIATSCNVTIAHPSGSMPTASVRHPQFFWIFEFFAKPSFREHGSERRRSSFPP